MSDKGQPLKRNYDLSASGSTNDPLWPVTLVFLILAICVGGLIVARGDFGIEGLLPSAKRLAANGFVQLAALLFLVVGLIWSAARARNAVHFRRMQFSAGLGLLLHIGLLTSLQYADYFIPGLVAEKKEQTPRLPFKIVSLPSDGRRLTKTIFDQGLARPVETDNRDESSPFERPTEQSTDPIPESAKAIPAAEPEQVPEISAPNLSRAESSATRLGQPSASRLDRQALSEPIPDAEAPGAPVPPVSTQSDPQTDAQIASGRQQTEARVGGGGQLGISPDLSTPTSRPDATRRLLDGAPIPLTTAEPSPARKGTNPDLRAPRVADSIPAAAAPSPSSNVEPGNTNVRGQAGRAETVRGADRLSADPGVSGMSRSGGAIQPRLVRRSEAGGTPGNTAGRPAPTTPFSQRSPIILAPGTGTGTENESVVVSGAGSGGNPSGEPSPQLNSRAGGTGRQAGGIPGRGSNEGLAGDRGTGATGTGTGAGLVGNGSGPSAAGRFATQPSGGGGGGFAIGKSNAGGVPGGIDGEEEGPTPGMLAGTPGRSGSATSGGAAGDGLPALGPRGTGRGSSGSPRTSALPSLGPGSGGSGGGTGGGTGAGSGGAGGLAGIGGGGTGGAGTNGIGGDSPGGVGPGSVGLPSRRARPQSEAIAGSGGRFILDKSNVGPSLDTRADPAPAFRQRGRVGRGALADGLGGNAESERAVELGLQFLKSAQFGDGHWSLHDFAAGRAGFDGAGEGTMDANTAGTGLALLAFLGAGYSHYDDPHRETVNDGVNYLIRNQKANGDLFNGGSQNVWLYSHGIAAIALCEAYGMTRDERLRQPAQRALDFIVAAQHPKLGGWRYTPQAGSDTSVSGWQMMALKSGELAGLTVPASAYAGVSKWLDSAQAQNERSRYIYRPGSQFEHQRTPSQAMTAEALLMRLYLGWDRSNPDLVEGANYLQQNLPQFGRTDSPLRDSYYWYYATQVMFQMQGEHWQAWNDQLRPLLVDSQVGDGPLAGSWDPGGAIPDRWGQLGGRIYVTSMHLLMLEVYYRHLPLYQNLAPEVTAP